MIPVGLQDDFYAGKRSELIKFVINDCVEVTSGEHQGVRGAIISIEAVDPEIIFLVERGDNGSSITASQVALTLLEE
jgi:hypothetical protein